MESLNRIHMNNAVHMSSIAADGKIPSTVRSPQTVQSSQNDSMTTAPNKVFLPCNNPDNLIEEATTEQVEAVFYMIVFPLLEVFGVTTNVINGMVFARQGLKDRINLCLFSLAVADVSVLLLMFSAKFFSFLGLFDKDLGEYWSMKQRNMVLGPLFGAMTISNLMTMIISLERCICVLSPFRAKKFLKTRHMLVLIVVMATYVLGIYSLLNMKYVTIRVTDPISNTSRWTSRLGKLYLEHRLVIDILYNHLLILAIPCVSVLVVIVSTSLTVTRLSSKLAWRQETASRSTKREMAVTKMLMVVCLLYVVTTIPSVTQRFFRTLVPGYLPSGKYCNTFELVQILVHVYEVANSSFNFIIYFSMGSKFRSTLRELLGQAQRENHRSKNTCSQGCELYGVSKKPTMAVDNERERTESCVCGQTTQCDHITAEMKERIEEKK